MTFKKQTFEELFQERLNDIEKRAKANGLDFTKICRETKIARATPDRWRRKAPLSITLLDDMEAVVIKAEAKA